MLIQRTIKVGDEKDLVVLSWAQAPGRQTPWRSPVDDECWFSDQVHFGQVLMPMVHEADRHQWINEWVWITPGLLLNSSIHRTRIKSICREMSQSSPFGMLLQRSPIFDCHPGELLFEEMWVLGWVRMEQKRAGGRLKHEDKLSVQNEVKFVFNTKLCNLTSILGNITPE